MTVNPLFGLTAWIGVDSGYVIVILPVLFIKIQTTLLNKSDIEAALTQLLEGALNMVNNKCWLGLLSLLFASVVQGYVYAKPVNFGGSNHFFYATGTADGFNTGDLWYRPALNVRPVVGTYHLNPSLVQTQMAAAKTSGQSVYVLPIQTDLVGQWESDSTLDGIVDGIYGYLVNYDLGGLNQQQQGNLKSIVTYASQLGFKRMIIRFGPNDNGSKWTQWDEAKFQKHWNHVYNTRALVDAHKSQLGTAMEVLYDLGMELGGIDSGQGQEFVKRLWGNYTFVFTNADTVGFSIAYDAEGLARLQRQKAWYGASLPKWWAFDMYPGTSTMNASSATLSYLNQIMTELGPLRNQPIMLLETSFNDAGVATGIQAAINSNRLLSIDQLSQWPTTYSTGNFSGQIIATLANPNAIFNNFAPLLGAKVVRFTASNADVMALADETCGMTASTQTSCTATLVFGLPPSGKTAAYFVSVSGGGQLFVGCSNGADQAISWITQNNTYTFNAYYTTACSATLPAGAPSGTAQISW